MLAKYDKMNESNTFVPDHLRGGIFRYIEQGIPPGSFLTAVIHNDLREAIGQADHINILALPTIVAWFHNNAPAVCWGSKAQMQAWITFRCAQMHGKTQEPTHE